MSDDDRQGEHHARPVAPWKSLTDRVSDLEDEIFGTREEAYRNGIKPVLLTLQRRLNWWGAGILAIVLATGLVNGNAAKVIGQFLAGIGSG